MIVLQDDEFSHLDTIYTLAINRDEAALHELREKGICLTTRYPSSRKNYRISALKRLAKQGYIAAVNFMIDKLHLDFEDALKGYIWSSYHDNAMQLIERGANLNDALFAYAIKGNVAMVNKLLKDARADKSFAVVGYAQIGFKTQVDALLANGNINPTYALIGYAIGEYIDEVNHLIEQGGCRGNAIQFCASSEHITQVNEMLQDAENPEILAFLRKCAARGYGLSKNIIELNKLINFPGCAAEAIGGLATNGYVTQVKQILAQRPSLEFAALTGFAQGGHFYEMNQLLKRSGSVGSHVAKSFINDFKGINSNGMLRLLSICNSTYLRRRVFFSSTKTLQQQYPWLLKLSKNINTLLCQHNMGFNEAKTYLIGITAQGKSSALIWLLQGQQLIISQSKDIENQDAPAIPLDIFLLISAYVLNLCDQDTVSVFKSIEKRLPKLTTKSYMCLFSHPPESPALTIHEDTNLSRRP